MKENSLKSARSYGRSEKEIETKILSWLARQRDVFAWKVNNVGVYDSESGIYRKSNSPFVIQGISDILGITNAGKMFAIEVKKPKGSKRSDDQIAFVNKINRMGGYACFVTSLEEAQTFIQMIRSQMNGLSGE